jgi:hypothetical protein
MLKTIPLIALLFVVGCVTPSGYDTKTVTNVQTLKASSLALIDHSVDPPATHAEEIKKVREDVDFAIAYERTKSNNVFTVKQLEVIASPDKNLLGGYVVKWVRDNKGQNPEFIKIQKEIIGTAFDRVITAENRKPKEK